MRHAKLDCVLFVVSANPPHKQWEVLADGEDRYAMVAAALQEEPGLEPSRMELEREGLSYMADTVKQVAEAYPEAAIFLIVGYDSLADLPRWRRPEEIVQRARILVVDRPVEDHKPWPPELEGHYEVVPFTESDRSSTEVRRRVAEGADTSDLIAPAVADIIRARDLYRACPS